MGNPRGKLLGRYEIVAELGRGAMGAVYKARDPKIDRFVAIKTVLLHQSVVLEQQEFRRRFFVEAQAAGRLLHPGIIAVFDVGEDPETSDPYIVMEYIEGVTLRELLASKGKKLPVHDALRIAQELAEALDYAHAQGVVHRDIKPANILVTKDGQAKIGDFGIAQLDLTHMTLPGRVLGTPAYMSPEQLEGEHVDGRSDLFSLGAILYSALTGYNPFQGNSATTVCFKVANHDPLQVTALDAELPHELDAIITRALAKNPDERYQRGMELADDLRNLRERRQAGKATLWFAPPPKGKTWLDGKATQESGLSGAVTAKNAPKPLRAAHPQKARGFGSMFSSWQVQIAIGVPLFVAALVVSVFAWREMHVQNPVPGSVGKNVDQANGVESVQRAISSVPLKVEAPGPDSEPGVQPHSEGDQATGIEITAPVAHAAPKGNASSPAAGGPAASATRRFSGAGVTNADRGAAAARSFMPAPPKTVQNAGTLPNASGQPGRLNETPLQPVAAPTANAGIADSNVEINIENHFSDATLKVWIDDSLKYEHPLRDGHKKRLLLLGGGIKETVTIPVVSGKHELRIEVRSASEQYDETKSVAGEFLAGGQRTLSINFDKHSRDMRVALGN